MAGGYVSVDGIARRLKAGYVGVDGVARKLKAGYVGVDGVARLCWSSVTVELTEEQKLLLQDFEYKVNLNGTVTLTNWKGTLNGVPSDEVEVPNHDFIKV